MTSHPASVIDTTAGLKLKDLTGLTIGGNHVESYAGERMYQNGATHRMWKCICQCGRAIEMTSTELSSGLKRRCVSCSRINQRPRISDHPLYHTWYAMKSRCLNPNNVHYSYYGGRGIGICEKWKSTFWNFYEDMISSYEYGKTLDRIDNSSGYCKDNCRWATKHEQANHKSSSVFIEKDGMKLTVAQWSKKLGVHQGLIRRRLHDGVTGDELFTAGRLKRKRDTSISDSRRSSHQVSGLTLLRSHQYQQEAAIFG